VLKKEGTLWLNLGDSYASSGKNSPPSDKSTLNGGKGVGPNEKVMNGLGRAPTPDNCKPKDLIGVPWMVAFALRADGWYLRQDIIWSKNNCMPESVTDRCTKSHEYLFLFAKSQRYYFDSEAIKEPSVTNDPRRPYTSKGAWEMDGRAPEQIHSGERRAGNDFSKRNKRSVWQVNTVPYREAHFATFPEKLIEPCILAGCPEGGICLDPFFGAGTTGLVAKKLGRHFIGIELNEAYIDMAQKRVAAVPARLDRWAEAEG